MIKYKLTLCKLRPTYVRLLKVNFGEVGHIFSRRDSFENRTSIGYEAYKIRFPTVSARGPSTDERNCALGLETVT